MGKVSIGLIVAGAVIAAGGLSLLACAFVVMRPRRPSQDPSQHPLVRREQR